MKLFQGVLAVGVVVVVGALAYEYLISQSLHRRVDTSERRLDDHSQALKARGEEIVEVQKRIALAEARITELSRAADRERAEVEKLQSALSELKAQNSEFDQSRRELEDLSRELKKSLERDTEFARRLLYVERQLGIERPRP